MTDVPTGEVPDLDADRFRAMADESLASEQQTAAERQAEYEAAKRREAARREAAAAAAEDDGHEIAGTGGA